jgi:hypothetical protein
VLKVRGQIFTPAALSAPTTDCEIVRSAPNAMPVDRRSSTSKRRPDPEIAKNLGAGELTTLTSFSWAATLA